MGERLKCHITQCFQWETVYLHRPTAEFIAPAMICYGETMICCGEKLVGRAVLSPPRRVGDNATVIVSQYLIAASIGLTQ